MDTNSSIRLDNFLKTAGFTATGGQAKILIQSGQVMVNGEVETRRRKQLKVGDLVEALGEAIQVTDQNAVPSESDNDE
jgi:ribosome-associated protein